MRAMDLVWVGLGGATGAVSRFLVGAGVTRVAADHVHLATLTVNVLGCLGIGALLGWTGVHEAPGPTTRAFFVVGVLGSFTTFSTFGWETHQLWREQSAAAAIGYVALSLALGLAAVWVGVSWFRG